jgi:hypothetical protein
MGLNKDNMLDWGTPFILTPLIHVPDKIKIASACCLYRIQETSVNLLDGNGNVGDKVERLYF